MMQIGLHAALRGRRGTPVEPAASPVRSLSWRAFVRVAAVRYGTVALLVAPLQAQSPTEDRIIVSGASGQLGGLVVDNLLELGVPPEQLILVSRTPDELALYAEMGASTRFGDFSQPESLPEAYAGGDRLLLISVNVVGDQRVEWHRNAIDAAVAAEVRHVAYTSFVDLENNTSALAADHRLTEDYLRASGVAWTMLRNQLYMDGLVTQAVRMITDGRAIVPAGQSPTAWVTREDCAAAAAAVLTQDGHEFQAYDITGPEAIGTSEIATLASSIGGAPITLVVPEEGGAGSGPGSGPSSFTVVSTAVAELTGRAPTSVKAFLEANRATLQAAAGR